MKTQAARARALAVLRVREHRAGASPCCPPPFAVVLRGGARPTGRTDGAGWDAVALDGDRRGALVVLARRRGGRRRRRRREPAVSPTVAVAEEIAPELYRLVRDLAERLRRARALGDSADPGLRQLAGGPHATCRATATRSAPRRTGTGGPAGCRRPGAGHRLALHVVDAGRRAARAARPGGRRHRPVRRPRHSRGPPVRPRAGRGRRGLRPRPAGPRRCGRAAPGARPASAGSRGCCCAAAARTPPRWSGRSPPPPPSGPRRWTTACGSSPRSRSASPTRAGTGC